MTTLAPFIQKVAVPSPTRALGTWDKQLLKELRDHINTIIDEETAESAEPVTLARFSWRSMITMLLVIVAVVVVFTQLKPEEIITALTNANPVDGGGDARVRCLRLDRLVDFARRSHGSQQTR